MLDNQLQDFRKRLIHLRIKKRSPEVIQQINELKKEIKKILINQGDKDGK